jgi:8-oxo-dGTP diphosphatase
MTNILDKELHRIATTCIIYNKEGKFLVTKRAAHKKAHPNRWTVPGGGLNTDDYTSLPQTHGNAGWYNIVDLTLRRELKEEVNVEVGPTKYLLDLTFIRPDGVPVLVLSYYAEYLSGDIKLDEDTVDFKWVTAEEAKDLDLIAGIYEELVMVADLLKK